MKILCVLYDDPVNGYPQSYARDDIPSLRRYPDGQTLPTPEALDFRPRIQTLGEQAGRFSTVSFLPTGNTLLLTLLLAAPLPLFVWLCGRALGADPGRGEFTLAVGSGLQAMARPFFAYLFLRETMRPGALADAHFQWNPRTLRLFLTNLRWLFPISLPTQFLLGALDAHGHAPWGGALGRLVLVVQLLAIAVFFWRILHPRTGIRGEAKGAGLFDRFRRFWFLLGVSLPVGLTLLSLLGYQFTSMQRPPALGAR